MDIKEYERDDDYILSLLYEQGSTICTKKEISIVFPHRYLNASLLIPAENPSVIGIFAIVDVETLKYSVFNIPTFVTLSPRVVSDITIKDNLYYNYSFDKDDIVIISKTLLQNNDPIFDIFLEFFSGGRIPWFMNAVDLIYTFLHSDKYAGTNIGNNPLAWELLLSIILKNDEDDSLSFRESVTVQNDVDGMLPKFSGLLDVTAYRSTLPKLSGGYFDTGLLSALKNPEEKASKIEQHIL